MKKFVQFFQEKVILSAVMCVLLVVVLTTATTAWYAVSNTNSVYGLELETGGIGGLKVALQPGGPDIMSDESLKRNEEDVPIISANLGDFKNIEEGKIAPGAYGPLTFYITSLSESITSYSIRVGMEYRPADGVSVTEEQKGQIEAMIAEHFSIYQEKYEDSEGTVLFREPVAFYREGEGDVEAVTGPLTFKKEVKAEIYWVWNYELTDIPGYENLSLYEQAADLRTAVRAYDEQDTLLGNYIDNIWFNIYIEGGM